MKRKGTLISLIILLIFQNVIVGSPIDDSWWDDDWDYAIEIEVSLDTSQKEAKFQPIDQRITFDYSCWAIDDKQHSIRVCSYVNNKWDLLESQIYNLTKVDDSHINSCRIVFLIPEYADGNERYYVFYDDAEKTDPNYIDHVSLEESYYHYEPISGYPLASDFYKIIDDESIPYIVSQEGQFMGYNTGQHITKMIENTKEVLPKNGDLFAAFDFKYCYDDGLFDYSSTSQKLISKEVFVDGNLMVSFGMVSQSKRNDLQTTVIYTYYHCPTSTTRIRVHVIHETLTSVEGYVEANTDGIFASLQSGGVKSNSIEDLNIGEILPYMHFVNEFNEISTYDMDIDPEYIPEDPDIRVISNADDVDLGSQPWISFNEGEQGLAHAVIFYSDDVVRSGVGEENGLQLNSFQMDYPHLPGLENNLATMQVGRNSFEPSSGHDVSIPDDFLVEFDAEFFTSMNNGRNAVEAEAAIYQQILDVSANGDNDYEMDENAQEKHSLSVLVHQSNSFPMGSALAALTGVNFSFVTVELYQDDVYLSSETATRLPMNPLDQEAVTFIEMIQAALNVFDLRNISLFKKVVFQDVKQGNYTVKIFRENKIFHTDREFIGFASIDVSNDENIHIFCDNEKQVSFSIKDQNQEFVEGAEVRLTLDGSVVMKGLTDESGELILHAPYNREGYSLEIWYHEVCFHKDSFSFPLIKKNSADQIFEIQRFDLEVTVVDTWDLPVGVEIYPYLLNEQGDSVSEVIQVDEDTFQFSDMPPNQYDLLLKYKSFSYEDSFQLEKSSVHRIVFPAEFSIVSSFYDSHGLLLSDCTLEFERDSIKKSYASDNGKINIDLPPGKYSTSVYHQDDLVGKKDVAITGEGMVDFITIKEPLFPAIVIVCMLTLIVFSLIIYYKKYGKTLWFIFIPLLLSIVSLFTSWWRISGSSGQIEASTQLYLLPSKLVSIISSPTIISGEQAYLPDIFLLLLMGIVGLIGVVVGLMILHVFFDLKGWRKSTIIQIVVLFLLLGVVVLFTFGMSMLSEISVGTLYGSGDLDFSMPGEGNHVSIPCSWGPSVGYYLVIIATFLYAYPLVSSFIFKYVVRR